MKYINDNKNNDFTVIQQWPTFLPVVSSTGNRFCRQRADGYSRNTFVMGLFLLLVVLLMLFRKGRFCMSASL